MIKKIGIVFVVLLAFGLMFGCTMNGNDDSLAREQGVDTSKVGQSFTLEQSLTEANQQRLIKSSPPPTLSKSLERENLIRRYTFLNNEDQMFYVYLVSYGKVMAYYTAQGKISSVNSRLTQEEQVFDDPYGSYASGSVVVGSPQLDGSYGTNGDGIFFFTTEGAYVEWNGEYIASDFPLSIETPPTIIENIN